MMIQCPKCGFEQPKDQFCAKCGVDMNRYHAKAPPLSKRIGNNSALYLVLILGFILGSVFYLRSNWESPMDEEEFIPNDYVEEVREKKIKKRVQKTNAVQAQKEEVPEPAKNLSSTVVEKVSFYIVQLEDIDMDNLMGEESWPGDFQEAFQAVFQNKDKRAEKISKSNIKELENLEELSIEVLELDPMINEEVGHVISIQNVEKGDQNYEFGVLIRGQFANENTNTEFIEFFDRISLQQDQCWIHTGLTPKRAPYEYESDISLSAFKTMSSEGYLESKSDLGLMICRD